jgi:hypothetical protein
MPRVFQSIGPLEFGQKIRFRWARSSGSRHGQILTTLPTVRGLHVVAVLTERLPVRLIPEERVAAAMRRDVIDYGCCGVAVGASAFNTH